VEPELNFRLQLQASKFFWLKTIVLFVQEFAPETSDVETKLKFHPPPSTPPSESVCLQLRLQSSIIALAPAPQPYGLKHIWPLVGVNLKRVDEAKQKRIWQHLEKGFVQQLCEDKNWELEAATCSEEAISFINRDSHCWI